MLNLLKANFYKIFHAKLTYALLIVISVFAIISSLAFMVVKNSLSGMSEYSSMFTGKYLFASSFTMTSNMGLIIPICVILFTTSDISNGTLRNKVTVGNSRLIVYLSHLISNISISSIFIIYHTIMTLLMGSLMLGYGYSFNAHEFVYILQMEALGIFTYAMVASLATMYALSVKSTPPTIIYLFISILVITFITQLPSFFEVPEKYEVLLNLIPEYTLLQGTFLVEKITLDTLPMLLGLLSEVIVSIAFTVLGYMIFSSRDIK